MLANGSFSQTTLQPSSRRRRLLKLIIAATDGSQSAQRAVAFAADAERAIFKH